MLRRNNNLTNVILSDVSKLTSALPAVGVVVTDANLERGAVVMTDAGMRRTTLSALADGDGFFIVQGKGVGVKLMRSPILNKGKIRLTTSKHKESRQQITTIGYNGTTGSLPVANNTTYWIKIRKNDNDAANRSQPAPLFAGPVKTDASGTQEELATALQKSGIKNFANEPANHYLRFEVINDEAGAAITVAAGADLTDLQFVNGSTIVTGLLSGAPALGTDEVLDNIVAGDYLRAGTAVTAPVYKVVANTAGTASTPAFLTLDIPYQGASTTIAYGSTEVIVAADAAAAEWGIVLTGIQANFDVNKFRDFYVNRFTAEFSDPSTLNTHTQGAYNGSGMWQQVAMDEYMTYGFEGENEMLGTPPTPRDQEVKIPGIASNTALTSKYSAIDIAWADVGQTALVSVIPARGNVLVYLNLLDSSGSGLLDTSTANTGETLAAALGLTPADLNE